MNPVLKFTSCMATSMDITCAAIADYASSRLALPAEFVGDVSWQMREQQFDAGEIQICWICGLPYTQKFDRPNSAFELLVAPVMQGDRYQNRPIYFSDVVVRQESPFHQFADLRGSRWAYNEPRSNSGFYVPCAYLAELGETLDYFGQVIASGAHQTSLQWILDGKVDAAAIDSTVLETELRRQPQLSSKIRVVVSLGPHPIPPWLISTAVPLPLREQVRSLLVTMQNDAQGCEILNAAAIDRFVVVCDRDYDPIRAMARRAETIIGSSHPVM